MADQATLDAATKAITGSYGVSTIDPDWIVRTVAPILAEPLVKALEVAGHALRSYQHGNSAPDLAEQVANHIDAILAAHR